MHKVCKKTKTKILYVKKHFKKGPKSKTDRIGL